MGAGSNNIVADGLVCCWDGGNRRCGTPSAGGSWTGLGVNAPATLVNQAEFADISLGAILLDGTDDKVTVANTTDIDGQNGFTFGIWLYFLDTPGNDYTCFSIYNGSAGDVYEFMLYIQDFSVHSKTIMLGTRGHTSSSLRSNNTAMSPSNNIGKWVHYCATYNGDGENTPTNYKIYFNGQDMGSDGTTDFGGGTNAIRWGIDGSGAGDLNGYIGRVAFYNRPLSADEVSQNYEATKSRFEPRITKSGLVANWDAGDPKSYNGGTTLKDTANHYDGTFVNNGSGGDISFDSANGGSLVFDGSDDYVNITTLPNCSSLARSVIIWLSVDDWPTSGSPVYAPFQSATDQFNIGFGITDGKIYFNGGGGTASTAQIDVALSPVPADGEWICWAMTIDSSGNIVAMYRNAVALSETANSSGPTIRTGTTIGCRLNSSTVENPLDGKIGSVRLYTKTLSAAEVMDNFQKTRGRFGV